MRPSNQTKFIPFWCRACASVVGIMGEFPPHCPYCGVESHWLPGPPSRTYKVTLKDWEFLKVNRIKP